MLYKFAKIICKICIQVYYGKIEVQGLEDIPTDLPIIMACNHPTGFLEPIIIACVMDRPLHFITRGDLFSNKLLGPILRATNQIPIFRFKDGYAGLRRNNESISAAKSALQSGGALLIFVEGRTEDIKMLKPLQKGMARISTALYDQAVSHAIVPVGINYIDTVTMGSRVMLNFGAPIDPKPIVSSVPDLRQALPKLNAVVFDKMVDLLLHVGDRSRHQVHDLLIDATQATQPLSFLPIIDRKHSAYSDLKKVSEVVDKSRAEDFTALQNIANSLNIKKPISHLLRQSRRGIGTYMSLLIFLPFAILGLVANVPPMLGGYLIERALVRSREFVAPIRFAASMGLALVYYPLVTVILVRMYGPLGLLFLLGIPLIFAWLYWQHQYRAVSKKYHLPKDSLERLSTIFTHLK